MTGSNFRYREHTYLVRKLGTKRVAFIYRPDSKLAETDMPEADGHEADMEIVLLAEQAIDRLITQ